MKTYLKTLVLTAILCVLLVAQGAYAQSPRANNALDFDGVDDIVYTPALPSTTGNFTYEFWVYPRATQVLTTVNAQQYVLTPAHGDFLGGGTHAGAGVTVGTNGIQVIEYNASAQPIMLSWDTSLTPLSGWTHVAVVYDTTNTLISLYVNGSFITSAATGTRTVHPAFSAIGGGNFGYLNGIVDEVRVWNRVLTGTEIFDNSNKALTGNESGLILYYRFDQGTAGGANSTEKKLIDSSATQSNGYVSNTIALTGTGSNWVTSGVTLTEPSGATSYTVTGAVTGSGGTVACASPVNAGATTTCTVTPDASYIMKTLTSQGGYISGTQFRTAPVFGNYSVKATFITKPSNALNFGNTNDTVRLAGTLAATAGNYSYELWVNPAAALATNPYVIYPPESGLSATNGSIGIVVGTDGINVVEYTNKMTTRITYAAAISGWTHVAFTYTVGSPSNTLTLYVNGASVATGTNKTNNQRFLSHIGGLAYGYGHFTGAVDEVRVWNKALTAAEVLQYRDTTLAGNETGLLLYYRFDQGTANGDNLTVTESIDSSASGIPGFLRRFTLTGTTSNWVGANAAIVHTVTATAGANGSIAPSGAQTFTHGATTSFTLTPAGGYHIDSVTGCGGTLSGNTYSISAVVDSCTVAATFSNTYLLTVSKSGTGSGTVTSNPAGINCGATCSFSYLDGTTVTLTATPSADSVFSGWSGAGCTGTGTCVVTMDAIKTVTAAFTLKTYSVTPSAGANGSISPATAQTVTHGQTTAFTVTPNTGYHIASVAGTCGGTLVGNTYTTNAVTADCTVDATFAINTYTVTPSAGANGSISPNTPQTVNYNQTTAFTLTPDLGYHIASVGGTCGGTLVGNTYTTNAVTADCTVSATFSNTYTVTPSAGANGSITPNTAQSVVDGATTSFTVTPDLGYHIASVSGTCGGSLVGNTYTTNTVTADCTVTASFAIDTFTITPSAGANGSISPATAQTVNYGGSQSFTITPSVGYHVADVLVDSVSVGAVTSYDFTNVTANHTISVTFAIDTYTITPSAGANGSISPATAQTVNYGGSQSFTITPSAGYHVADVLVDSVSVGAVTSYTFTNVTANHTISASFAINTYTVTSSAGANGSISPNTPQTVNYNQTTAFTLTPDLGYHIASVGGTCGGTLVGNTYTTNAVTADCTVSATFAINTYLLTVNKAGTGTGTITSSPAGINYGSDNVETYDHGTSVTLTGSPTSDSKFTGWSGACTGTGNCVVTMDAAKNVTANFNRVIALQNESVATSATAVTATLNYPNAVKMRFMMDDKVWKAWEMYSASKKITLPSGDGIKTVYVQFGNEPTIYYDTITLDTKGPIGTVVIDGGNPATESLNVTLTIAAVDNSDITEMCVSATTTCTAWESFSTTKAFTLAGTPGVSGSKTVNVKFKDSAGKISSAAATDTIMYVSSVTDYTNTSVIINGGAQYASATAALITFSGLDPSFTQVSYSTNGTTWSAYEAIKTPKSLTLSTGDGIKVVYAKFKNALGVASTEYGSSIILDTKPPVGTIIINGGAMSTNDPNVTVSIEATDINGVSLMQYSLNGTTWSAWEPYATAKLLTLSGTDGAKKVAFKFKDNAGKISVKAEDSIILDRTALAGKVVINGGTATTTTNTLVKLGLTATNMVFMQISVDGGTTWGDWEPFAATKYVTLLSGAGLKTVAVKFKDFTGNESPVATATITLVTPPSYTAAGITINSGAQYTIKTAVTLAISNPDPVNNVSMTFSTNGTTWSAWELVKLSKSFTLPSGDGVKTVLVKFKTAAGEVSGLYGSSIILDATVPKGMIVINGGSAATNDPNVTVDIEATDTNGVSQMQYSVDGTTWSAWIPYVTTKTVTLTGTDGTKKVSFKFKDNAGNISAAVVDSINLDRVAPTGTVVINTGAASTTSDTVKLTLAATGAIYMQISVDGGTTWGSWELFATSKSVTLPSGAGLKTVAVKFKDFAGNESAETTDTITRQ